MKFHDGAAFNADDAVFSLERAMARRRTTASTRRASTASSRSTTYTIDIFTKGPNPVLLRQLTELRMMDQGWAEKNKSLEPKDIKTKEENFAHRNANGTGPFMLKCWEPDVQPGAGGEPELVGQGTETAT